MSKSLLHKFGLSDTEAKIYLGLLEFGQTTITELAKYVGMKRLRVNFNIDNLVKRGLVIRTVKGKRKQIVAEHPEKLYELLEDKKDELSKTEKEVEHFIDHINRRAPQIITRKNPLIEYYEGEKGFKEVCQRSIDNSTKEVLFFSNFNEWRKVYTTDYGKEYYVPERLKKKVFLKALACKNEEGYKMKEEDNESYRETRLLPESFHFSPTLIICDQEISIMLSNQPYTSIVINDLHLAEMLRETFGHLWRDAK